MSRNSLMASVLAMAAAATLLVSQTQASETGMASIHTWVKVGKKTCLSGHDHSSSGSGGNQKLAELSAIRSWASFTDLEYGSSWANFNISINKRMSCSRGAFGFQCDLEATPCRPF